MGATQVDLLPSTTGPGGAWPPQPGAAARSGLVPAVASRVSVILGTMGLALWLVAVTQASFSAMGAVGLLSVLGWPFYLGLALLAAGLAVELVGASVRGGADRDALRDGLCGGAHRHAG
jgi:hypothetical protein